MEKTMDYILEVARCGGISKAAKNLYITPSALSKYVQQKEEELNVKLFARNGKKFSLTYAGERYVSMLEEMLEYKRRMESEMRHISHMHMGCLRFGFQMSLAEVVIVNIIKEFQQIYPNVRIISEEGSSVELMNLLRNNELDLVLSLEDSGEEEFCCETLTKDCIVLIAEKNSPLKSRAVKKDGFRHLWLDVQDYKDEKMVMYSEGQMFRKFAERNFTYYGFKPDVDIWVTTTKTALLSVANGIGITFTSELLVKQQHFEDKIEMFSYGKEQMEQNLSVIYNRNTMLSQEIRSFSEIAGKYF